MEAALDVYRKVVAAIEDSDDVTRAVLDDAVPKLHAAADRLVDVAEGGRRRRRSRATSAGIPTQPQGPARRRTCASSKRGQRGGRRDLRDLRGASRPPGQGRPGLHR